MSDVKSRITSLIGPAWRRARRLLASARPFSSADYWEARYSSGGTSGVGSYGEFAEFKSQFLNEFVNRNDVQSVIEFGCGDGNQLALSRYPKYMGIDVSETALDQCRRRFASDRTKAFVRLVDYRGEVAELALSLDVIFHLVEDAVYDSYMAALAQAGTRFLIVYSSNCDEPSDAPHVKHRPFEAWLARHAPQWTRVEKVNNKFPYAGDYRTGSFADFYVFERKPHPSTGGANEAQSTY